MLITGVPGMGKTSIISWIANNYINNDKIIILAFKDLAQASLEKNLLSAICSRFNCNDEDLENKILISDDFDEMKALDIREKLLNDFINDLNDFNNFKCIITSRPGYIDTDYFQNVFELKQFDIGKVSIFYEKITGKVLLKKVGFLLKSQQECIGLSNEFYQICRDKIRRSKRYLTKDYNEGKYDAIWRLVVPEQMYYLKNEGGKSYEKTGFTEKGHHACVSGGDDDRRHVDCARGNRTVETERYRMGCGSVAYGTSRELLRFQILLTAGEDGKWYIYPDSPLVMS